MGPVQFRTARDKVVPVPRRASACHRLSVGSEVRRYFVERGVDAPGETFVIGVETCYSTASQVGHLVATCLLERSRLHK